MVALVPRPGSSDAVMQTLAQARTIGALRYQGRPCPHGHPGIRYTYNSSCVDCTLTKNRLNRPRKVANRERWRRNNAHRMKEIRARQYKNNPTPAKMCATRRRTIKTAALGHYCQRDINKLLKQQQTICATPHCLTGLEAGFHIDHKKPLARGGSNWPRNLQLLCAPCNGSKGAKTMREWAKWLSR